MVDKLTERGFYRWFSDYSEKYHHLTGWAEYDQYLDEVELPPELFNALILKWLRDDHSIIIEPRFGGPQQLNNYAFDIVSHSHVSGFGWKSSEEAVSKGIETALNKYLK